MNILLLLLLLTSQSSSLKDFLQISTSKGIVRGKTVVSYGNQTGLAYLNIPLAQAPIGNLRFRKPVPARPWKGVRDATQFGPACTSDPKRTFKPTGIGNVSEDCLQINVFSNEHCMKNGGCAVMAVIHGGQLLFESATIVAEDRVINTFVGFNRNVVVVTMPYRLGIFGLINLAPDLEVTASKNVLLWDLLLGLKWIRKEISHFGGDPARLTVLGHSSGAALVSILCVSPLTMHLFNQAVIMSGPVDRAMSISKDIDSLASQRMAKLVNCATDKTNFRSKKQAEEVIACLRSKPADELFEAQGKTFYYKEQVGSISVDGEFITATIQELKKFSKPKSILIGTVTAEMRDTKACQDKTFLPIIEQLSFLCDQLSYGMNFERPSAAKEECMKYYSRPNETQFFSDNFQYYAEAVDMLYTVGRGKPSFLYSFSYDQAGTAFRKYSPSVPSPSHSEDYIYIFGTHRGNFTPKDYRIETIYSGLIANFVNYGAPFWENQKWKPWNPEELNYFEINFDDSFTMPGNKKGYYRGAIELLRKTIPSAGGSSYPLSVFPSSYDMISPFFITSSCIAKWTGIEDMKVLAVDNETCNDWLEFMDLLHVAEAVDVRPRMFSLSENFSFGSSLFWFPFLVLFTVFLIVVKYKKKRSTYTEF